MSSLQSDPHCNNLPSHVEVWQQTKIEFSLHGCQRQRQRQPASQPASQWKQVSEEAVSPTWYRIWTDTGSYSPGTSIARCVEFVTDKEDTGSLREREKTTTTTTKNNTLSSFFYLSECYFFLFFLRMQIKYPVSRLLFRLLLVLFFFFSFFKNYFLFYFIIVCSVVCFWFSSWGDCVQLTGR